MNFFFLMDPLESINIKKDTTFILMVGAHRAGHRTFYVAKDGLSLLNGELVVAATEVVAQKILKQPFIIKKQYLLNSKDIHAFFVRTDPPFDQKYLTHTWLLDLLPKHIPVINSPNGIRTANEKLWATQFRAITPRAFIGSKRELLLDFINSENEVIAKPLNGFGGGGIFYIKKGDVNTKVILETLSRNFRDEIKLQKYIPDAKNGDKRILLLGGEPLGAVLRVHEKGDHRNNFFAGGKPKSTLITKRDLEIIGILKPKLKELGLYFVGIDIIGGYLIEVNVTSPTCLQEMNALYDKQLEDQVIEFTEKLIDPLEN